MKRIVLSVVSEMRQAKRRQHPITASSFFTPVLLLVIIGALVMALQWPRPAQLVPVTACILALVMCSLNFVNELFGAPDRVSEREEVAAGHLPAPAEMPQRLMRIRSAGFFAWIVGFIGLVAVVGFLPAMVVFVCANMMLAYGKTLRTGMVSGLAVGCFCWVVFHVLLHVIWPESLLGDAWPAARVATGFI
jgi:hypothetical protein